MIEDELYERAVAYVNRFRCDIVDKLGSGQDGHVWETDRPSAIKVFETDRSYTIERDCYLRLQDDGVSEINGLTIPRLIGFENEVLVVEMERVHPPYLLDFGKAHLDRAPDYAPEVMAESREKWIDLFEDDWPTVDAALGQLAAFHGIYYMDPKPDNIRLR